MVAYRRDIDGLRAAAVLAVLGFHAFPAVVPGGYVGVDVFFVISGFLITGIILNDVQAERFSFVDFYRRRIRRIFPALVIVLLSTLFAGWAVLFADEFYQLGWQALAGAAFASNFLFWHEAGYFDVASGTKPLLHLWSLAIEEQFYLLWPLTLLCCRRIGIRAVIATVGLASFAYNVWAVRHDHTAAFYSPASRFWELMLGAYLATVDFRAQPKRASDLLSVGGAGAIFVAIFLFVKTSAFPGWVAIMPTAGAAALIAAGPKAVVNRVISLQLFVAIGLISYPLYLWHWPLLTFLRTMTGGEPSIVSLAATLVLSVILSAATCVLLERPVKRLRLPAWPLGASMASGAALALIVILGVGFPARTANSYATLMVGARPPEHGISDGSCARLLHHTSVSKEVCLTETPDPEVLLVGDSHAMSLNSAAHEHLVNLNTMLIAGSSCLPFVDYTMHGASEPTSNRNCDEIAASAIAAAKSVPTVGTIVLATMGPTYFADVDGYGIYKNERPVEDRAKAFLEGYSKTIEDLLTLGKRVVFVIDVPELDFDPTACIARRFSLLERPECLQTRAEVDVRQREYRKIIAELVLRHPGLQIYDSIPTFCDARVCRWHDGGHALYFDKNHLSAFGSTLALRDLISKIGNLSHTIASHP